MSLFIPLRLESGGKRYTAKLYGSKVVCPDLGLSLERSDLKSYRVKILKRKISLRGGDGEGLSLEFGWHILSWLDPLFFVRLFTIGVIFITPVLFAGVLHGLTAAIAFLPIAAISAALGIVFFRISRPGETHGIPRTALLLIPVCLPVVYWFPVSAYIFTGFSGAILIVYLLHTVYSGSINFRKYFFSAFWLVLIVFYYLWIMAAFQIFSIFKTYTRETAPILTGGGMISYGSTSWEKPLDWKLEPASATQALLNRRNFLWSFSPYPVHQILSSDLMGEFGWIAGVNETPEKVFSGIAAHLDYQKTVMLSEITAVEFRKSMIIKGSNAIFQSMTYYDMVERKMYRLVFIILPASRESSLIFSFRLPLSASVGYYGDLVGEGISKTR